MPEVLSRLQQQFMDYWKNLDKSQKTRIYITASILVVAIIAGIFWVTRVTYVPLVSNADQKDVKAMIAILDNKKISYRLTSDSKGIMVNSKQNDQAQVALIDYPKAGLTFEDAFSMIKMNTTESDKKALWKKYEESKISEKLKLLDSLQDAWVDLAIPEPQFFFADNQNQVKPTAAVTVTPKTELTPKQVQGIIMIVARSVENLDPKDVTVVDNNLKLLSTDSADSTIDQVNTQDEMRIKRSDELARKVYNLYNGPTDAFDMIRVVANPVLDFTKQSQQSQALANPDGMSGGALISDRQIKEEMTNGTQGGAPGVSTNPGTTSSPSYQLGSTGTGNYKKSDITENFDYSKTQTQTEKSVGDLVPDKSSMTVTLWYGKSVPDDTKLTAAFITQFKDDVSKATGIPSANISINKYKIGIPQPVQVPLSDVLKNMFDTYGFFAIMMILVIGLMIVAIPRKKKELEPVLDASALAAAESAQGPRFVVPEGSEPVPEINMEEKSEIKKQIEKFVKEKPDAVAQLLRNWLTEEWE